MSDTIKILAPRFKRGNKTVAVLGTSGRKGKFTHTLDAETGHIARVKTSHFNRKATEATRFAPANPKTGYTRVRSAKVEVEVPRDLAELIVA